MAFDALRLRNIIQLIGILSECRCRIIPSHIIDRHHPVFHGALIPMAALQVHQTQTALVMQTNCNGAENYVVSYNLMNQHHMTHNCIIAMRWTRNIMEKSWAFSDRYAVHSGGFVASPHVLDQGVIRWVWVCYFRSSPSPSVVLNLWAVGQSFMSWVRIRRWRVCLSLPV